MGTRIDRNLRTNMIIVRGAHHLGSNTHHDTIESCTSVEGRSRNSTNRDALASCLNLSYEAMLALENAGLRGFAREAEGMELVTFVLEEAARALVEDGGGQRM